jgi:hypothetical protein
MELAIQQNRTVGLTAHCILIRRDGYECAIEDSAAPIHDRDGQVSGAVIVFHDVSMARAMVLEMSHLAQHDSHRFAQPIVAKRPAYPGGFASPSQSPPSAGAVLDLDGFKHINDSLGHSIGDKLLNPYQHDYCLRAKSDTVSRQGGDEFAYCFQVTHRQMQHMPGRSSPSLRRHTPSANTVFTLP